MKILKTIRQSLMPFAIFFSVLAVGCSKGDSGDDGGNPPNGGGGGGTNPPPEEKIQTIGLNFNEQLQYIDLEEIGKTRTTWVRGFIDFFELYNSPSLLDSGEKIEKYLTLSPNGYSSILSIKWVFRGKDFPAIGSQEMEDYMQFLDKILDKVWNKTDIIIVGNEPFIETDSEDYGGAMYDFYVTALERVRAYEETHSEKPIYFGAFDNMYQDRRRNLAVLNGLLDYSKQQAWIDGVDMHIHHSTPQEMTSAMDYINSRLRADQNILVSEYSLMKHFRSHLTGTIPSSFATTYGYSADMKNYQYIDMALKYQVTKAEWDDFLRSSPWFEERKNYLLNSYVDIFTKYDKFYIATYAFRQSYPFNTDFTANTDPWVLNGIYANRTVKTDANGDFQFNYSWIDDFRIVQDISNN